ncbi:hypothetical protein [Vannielia litorea]|uniref:hypothetical protein n=1 Tax=Vannielia litorea TaxID=1217970 RepID=UPI001BD16996|nr:hypothetical protein [Vannielia litorea]MBS8228180.1 hypothetical protein [Vannielia litorea]
MKALRPDTVTRLPGERFRHARGAWAVELPLAELPRWLRFYRWLAARRTAFYAASRDALEAFAREVQP